MLIEFEQVSDRWQPERARIPVEGKSARNSLSRLREGKALRIQLSVE